jgi:hypothetical protein
MIGALAMNYFTPVGLQPWLREVARARAVRIDGARVASGRRALWSEGIVEPDPGGPQPTRGIEAACDPLGSAVETTITASLRSAALLPGLLARRDWHPPVAQPAAHATTTIRAAGPCRERTYSQDRTASERRSRTSKVAFRPRFRPALVAGARPGPGIQADPDDDRSRRAGQTPGKQVSSRHEFRPRAAACARSPRGCRGAPGCRGSRP